VDTTRADSLARADTTDYTALFLKAQQDAKRLIPAAPRIGAGRLLPLGTRIIFDRDSIAWYGAETAGDLLTRVPGAYLLRGGWPARRGVPLSRAHGAASGTYLPDAIARFPLGSDRLAVAPPVLPLSFTARRESERPPGKLPVGMFPRHHDRSAPYSRIGIASG